MPSKRRYWCVPKAGNLKRLSLQQDNRPDEPLGSDEVQVEVHAIGLNFADIFAITGLYSATPEGAFVPGLEFSGVVQSIGNNVVHLKEGDRVMAATRFGGYADSIRVPAAQCTVIPEGWTYQQGAAFLVQALTAWYALFELGALKPQHRVLVHSAAGGVGLMALEMIRHTGAEVIACVGSDEKATWLRGRGIEEVFVRSPNFKSRLLTQLNGRPLHLVLDAIGGKIQKQSFDALAPMGRLVTFGAAQYTPNSRTPRWLKSAWLYLTRPRYDALAMVSDNKSIAGFNLIWLWQHQGLFDHMLSQLVAMKLPPPFIGGEYPFEQAPTALEFLRSGQSKGKVVLKVKD